MFCDAQTTACPIVMPRKFSQPTVSLCGSWKASLVTMRMGPRPAFDLLEKRVVAQAGRHRMMVDVVAHQFLGVVVPLRLVLLAIAVLRVRLQMQEVGADGTVAVLEAGQDDAVFHLRHLGADLDRQARSADALLHGAYQVRPMPSPTARGLKMCDAPPAPTMTAFARNT